MYFGSYDSIFRTRKHRQRDGRRITESWNRQRRHKFPIRLCVPFLSLSLLAASQTVSLFILDKFDTRDVERYEVHPSENERALWTLCHCIRITAKYRVRRKSFRESEVNTYVVNRRKEASCSAINENVQLRCPSIFSRFLRFSQTALNVIRSKYKNRVSRIHQRDTLRRGVSVSSLSLINARRLLWLRCIERGKVVAVSDRRRPDRLNFPRSTPDKESSLVEFQLNSLSTETKLFHGNRAAVLNPSWKMRAVREASTVSPGPRVELPQKLTARPVHRHRPLIHLSAKTRLSTTLLQAFFRDVPRRWNSAEKARKRQFERFSS